jgi:hypothetical protein
MHAWLVFCRKLGEGGRLRFRDRWEKALRLQRSRLGIPKAERDGSRIERFQEVVRATLPYVRPEPPRWFRGKEPLAISKGRPSWVAVRVARRA